MWFLAEMIENTFIVFSKLTLLALLIFGSLGTVIFYQDHVIATQSSLIRQMVKNPSCLIPEGK